MPVVGTREVQPCGLRSRQAGSYLGRSHNRVKRETASALGEADGDGDGKNLTHTQDLGLIGSREHQH
jgi:hypothetical protein